jgi:hypothetical protein
MYQVRFCLIEFVSTMMLIVTNLSLAENNKTSKALMKFDAICYERLVCIHNFFSTNEIILSIIHKI